MKTKLLRKSRKRFTITYFPKGYYIDTEFYDGEFVKLTDTKDSWRNRTAEINKDKKQYPQNFHYYFKDLASAKEKFLSIIKSRLQTEYFRYSVKNRKPVKSKNIWWG